MSDPSDEPSTDAWSEDGTEELPALARIEALCGDDDKPINPPSDDARQDARYMEGWDDAIDYMQQAIRRALSA